ncbi:aminoglycoside phosphotransferase family protein [Kitasatospora sp. NPDC085895]|uniref:aminoglycoside phosphotransferase family protein n=1 Tax=Kitasatospora sp. NPDC085895 TaxID=3155057 RepID=UPI00344C0717
MSAPVARIGGFAESEVSDVLESACRQVGLDPSGAQILRGHTNAVFRLPAAGAVAKIARAGTPHANVRRTVELVRWLTSLNFPTVELLAVDQPVAVGAHTVTFWEYLPQPDTPVPAADLATPLRTLHRLPPPPFEIRPLDTVTAIRRSLDATTALPTTDIEYLSARVDQLEQDLEKVRFALPTGLLQGDPQHRNALHHLDGAVLCDWDTACHGPAELDLVTVEIHCRRFGYGPSHYQDFAHTYGFDVTSWSGYTVLRDLRELRMITTNAKRAAANTPTLTEVVRRVKGLRHANSDLRWNIL